MKPLPTIKCTLIEVNNDNRAIICRGKDPHGIVESTSPLAWINYDSREFRAGARKYEFNTADEAVA